MTVEHHVFPGCEGLLYRLQIGVEALEVGESLLDGYKDAVTAALKKGSLTEADIDTVLRGSFRTEIRLGLLDPPSQVPYSKLKGAESPVDSQEHEAVAKQVSLESIAVIGPLADQVPMGSYSGPPYTVSPLDGIKEKVGPGVVVRFAADNTNQAAVEAARCSDVAVVVVGNHPMCGLYKGLVGGLMSDEAHCPQPWEGMENHDRLSLDLADEALVKEVYAADPKTIVVLRSGFPYVINWTQQNVPAILHATHSGQEDGNALADVLFGDCNPAGRLVQTWPKSLDQLPPMMDYDIRHGRTYMCFDGEPLHPLGYGLSYTSFAYSNLRTSEATLSKAGEIEDRGDPADGSDAGVLGRNEGSVRRRRGASSACSRRIVGRREAEDQPRSRSLACHASARRAGTCTARRRSWRALRRAPPVTTAMAA